MTAGPAPSTPPATHRRRKVEIIVEQTLVPAVLRMIDGCGAKGYTVLPTSSGRGHTGARGSAHVTGVFDNVMVIAVCEASVADRILAKAPTVVGPGVGVVWVSDVDVLRADHF
ncbi:MAG: hypothetical protein EAZ99_13345 [Alphaproteobacteria bacterium]|nr:hypothetical protein [Alphaproteobacteria bacterium]TAD88569.1 MAG: hypothetical protein EAZ99_13345 [Alphaproteobacteria bacterium]